MSASRGFRFAKFPLSLLSPSHGLLALVTGLLLAPSRLSEDGAAFRKQGVLQLVGALAMLSSLVVLMVHALIVHTLFPLRFVYAIRKVPAVLGPLSQARACPTATMLSYKGCKDF